MKSEPISLIALGEILEESVSTLNEELLQIWDEIKITPEKWSEKSSGTERDGFWVVAQFDGEVIWYNDLEEGFNVSKFRVQGEIGEYFDDKYDLNTLLWHLF